MYEERVRLAQTLNDFFSLEELITLAFKLDIDYENLVGEGKSGKIRELIIYLERKGRLNDLISEVARIRPNAPLHEFRSTVSGQLQPQEQTEDETRQKDIIGLQSDVSNLRQLVLELKSSVVTNEKFDGYFAELLRYANRAVDRTEELKADIVLPKNKTVRMFSEPQVNRLENLNSRLEQNRSDEVLAFLLIGLFAGAAVGVVVNWATDDPFNPTPVSITFLIFFLFLTLVAGFFAYQNHKRVLDVQNQIDKWPTEAMKDF